VFSKSDESWFKNNSTLFILYICDVQSPRIWNNLKLTASLTNIGCAVIKNYFLYYIFNIILNGRFRSTKLFVMLSFFLNITSNYNQKQEEYFVNINHNEK